MIPLYNIKNKAAYFIVKRSTDFFLIKRDNDNSLVMIPRDIIAEYINAHKDNAIDLYGPPRVCREYFSQGQGTSFWDKYTHGQESIITSLARFFFENEDHDINLKYKYITYQRLLQGPPGTGKSYRINQDLDKLKAKSKRIVCHQESTNAQFIGSYRPQSHHGQITYAFSPGPFIKLLAQALKDQDTPHVLVIEELNRANSAAMFAEAFQLLDRVGSGDKEGWSEHPTDLGDDVLDYLKRELGEEHEEYQRTLKEGVRLPPNFAIWATMNTADQGVFPMDTAFKRRWSFEHLGVDEGYETWRCEPWNPPLPTAGVPWQTFRVALNHALEQLEVEEDRLIGPFFLTERELQEPEAHVVGKVLSYLRDDVLRYEPKGLFVGVNSKGEPDPEGRSPSFAWLKRQHARASLLSLFKGELSASLEFAHDWIKSQEKKHNTKETEEPTVHEVLSDMSDAQTPNNTSEEHPIPGES